MTENLRREPAEFGAHQPRAGRARLGLKPVLRGSAGVRGLHLDNHPPALIRLRGHRDVLREQLPGAAGVVGRFGAWTSCSGDAQPLRGGL